MPSSVGSHGDKASCPYAVTGTRFFDPKIALAANTIAAEIRIGWLDTDGPRGEVDPGPFSPGYS